MKKVIWFLMACSALCMPYSNTYAWGVWGHQHINKGAIMSLPGTMGTFFYNHADFITEESVVPDIRKYTINDKAEYPRHFADLEAYGFTLPASMPQTMTEAIAKFGMDTLNRHGILPWYIEDVMAKLTKAFKEGNKGEILLLAADLGHYVGDAHMPLHTSVNHNGQFTGQKGIHAFWEAQLPELFGDGYMLNAGEGQYVLDVPAKVWEILQHSHALTGTLLEKDKVLRASMEQVMYKKRHDTVVKSRFGQPVFSDEYAGEYNKALSGMVEQQMMAAIRATADLWYTAWVNAGKPDLSVLDPAEITARNKAYYKSEAELWKNGKVTGFKVNNEFIY